MLVETDLHLMPGGPRVGRGSVLGPVGAGIPAGSETPRSLAVKNNPYVL
jgi:hypothetical protein